MKSKHLLLAAELLLIVPMLSGLPTSVSAQVMNIYGMTEAGGANNLGVLFQFNQADTTYTKKLDFDGTTKGSNPYGSLMQASDGKLYGMCYVGGENNDGVLFQYDPMTSTYTKKLDFNDTINGSNPRGSLIQASDGNLYGMTARGGAYGAGVIFQYNPASSAYAVLLQFGTIGVTGPADTYGSLIVATDKKLYGLSYGAATNNGVLFQFDPVTSSFIQEVSFDGESNGAYPVGSLIQATDGNIYGLTYQGGTSNEGVLFTYVPNVSVYAKKHDFGSAGVTGVTGEIGITGPTTGTNPTGSLVEAPDGMLYGMTESGGTYNYGVLFKYDPVTYIYTKVFDFDGAVNGRNPYGSLMRSSNGNLYGMTKAGGANGDGVLFQFNPVDSTFTKELDFTGANGKFPMFTDLIEISQPAGINEFSDDNNISLSPNPATDELLISGDWKSATKKKRVTIFNPFGETIYTKELTGKQDVINCKLFSAGIYFVQIVSESNRWTGKFVKE